MSTVLLIEDFTVLQGIQGELLDALTEPPVRGGAGTLPDPGGDGSHDRPLRRNRANLQHSRRVRRARLQPRPAPGPAGQGVAPDDVADFVAGYLNASRLGQTRLEQALQERGRTARRTGVGSRTP